MLYSVRNERLLMEEIEYSMLFPWFVRINLDKPVRDVTVFLRRPPAAYCKAMRLLRRT